MNKKNIYVLVAETKCEKYKSFAVVSQLKLARGFGIDDQGEAMMPIAGKGNFISHFC